MESPKDRIARFRNGSPIESIETLLNSIHNFFANEVSLTTKPENVQTSLMFLGIHAIALTISEDFWGKSGESGYKLFLKHFVDGDSEDLQFSTISNVIHDWRNIIAHRWLSAHGHTIGYDYDMDKGWEKRDEVIFINPAIYCKRCLGAFDANGKIWEYEKIFNQNELEDIKQRIISRYEEGQR